MAPRPHRRPCNPSSLSRLSSCH
uniref:Uncharacterized protein n=1 Tax=Anguilla anguilla TaxID=7936 RepID=A0A0E9TS70_ANGAN